MREDFWDENIGEERLDNFEDAIPADVLLSDTFCTYNVIDELNRVAEKRGLGP